MPLTLTTEALLGSWLNAVHQDRRPDREAVFNAWLTRESAHPNPEGLPIPETREVRRFYAGGDPERDAAFQDWYDRTFPNAAPDDQDGPPEPINADEYAARYEGSHLVGQRLGQTLAEHRQKEIEDWHRRRTQHVTADDVHTLLAPIRARLAAVHGGTGWAWDETMDPDTGQVATVQVADEGWDMAVIRTGPNPPEVPAEDVLAYQREVAAFIAASGRDATILLGVIDALLPYAPAAALHALPAPIKDTIRTSRQGQG